mgnify:CR=1 FL=1
MKIIYEYTPLDDGYKLSCRAEDIPTVDNSSKYDSTIVRNAYKAILNYIMNNHESCLPLSGLIKYIES